MILALDISTTTIGIAFIRDNQVIHTDFIDLKKEKELLDKISIVDKYIDTNELIKKYSKKITEIRIEQFLQNFRRGLSSAATITKLAGFNTSVQYLLFKKLSLYPNMISSNTARSSLGINLDKDRDTKEQICEFVNLNYYKLPRKILKGGPNKGQETWANHANDIADAIVIGLS